MQFKLIKPLGGLDAFDDSLLGYLYLITKMTNKNIVLFPVSVRLCVVVIQNCPLVRIVLQPWIDSTSTGDAPAAWTAEGCREDTVTGEETATWCCLAADAEVWRWQKKRRTTITTWTETSLPTKCRRWCRDWRRWAFEEDRSCCLLV